MMRHFSVELTNMCMIEDKEKGHVVALDKKGAWRGITFPGGHAEQGESILESVKREVQEETGLSVKDPVLCGMIHWSHSDKREKFLVMLYKAQVFAGELCEGGEEGRVFWMKKEDLPSAPLAPGMETYLAVFDSDHFCEAFGEWNEEGMFPLKIQ